MKSILIKELNAFFSSPIGYLVIAIYLLINGLFLWVFNGDLNILHAGFADLSSYFFIAPWIFIFLIPAITMKSFTDEFHQGTIEILKTKPITDWEIVLGKFTGSLFLVLLAILPTFIYIYSIHQLGNPIGNIHLSTTFGSFVGLLFLASTYTAIGIFSSAISRNQIVSFIIAVGISLLLFQGFEIISKSNISGNLAYTIQQFGMYEHFKSIGKGVLDTRNLTYFISVTLLFLYGTKISICDQIKLKKLGYLFTGLLLVNIIGSTYYKRIDLSEDQRHTLSQTAKDILSEVNELVLIDVYLQGDFPAEFKRLQIETKLHLEELKALNKNIQFRFIDPINRVQQLIEAGLEPSRLQIQENGKISEIAIFPWAVLHSNNKTENISLLKDIFSNSQDEQLQSSIQNLEYAFTNGIQKLISKKSKKIAVLKGNGELEDLYIADFLKTLSDYYFLAPFTLDSVAVQPQKTLQEISEFDLAIIAKPSKKFTEEEKYTLDQYIMNGGKTIWLIDNVQAELDSLMQTGETLAYPRELGLNDFFFSYGLRINQDLIRDLESSQITLATGNIGNQTQFDSFLWEFHPLASSENNHPINTNIEAVNLKFATSIDTLKNNIHKTILLRSSPFSKSVGTPFIVSLQSIVQQANSKNYNNGNKSMAVLLEGKLKSVYRDRIKPFKIGTHKDQSDDNLMVVISDGDVIKNEVVQGQALKLGFDKWTQQKYGNKEFLLNAINYLLDDKGLVNIRSRIVKINFLDKQKAYEQSQKWQLINIVFPLGMLLLFGLIFNYIRKKKFQ